MRHKKGMKPYRVVVLCMLLGLLLASSLGALALDDQAGTGAASEQGVQVAQSAASGSLPGQSVLPAPEQGEPSSPAPAGSGSASAPQPEPETEPPDAQQSLPPGSSTPPPAESPPEQAPESPPAQPAESQPETSASQPEKQSAAPKPKAAKGPQQESESEESEAGEVDIDAAYRVVEEYYPVPLPSRIKCGFHQNNQPMMRSRSLLQNSGTGSLAAAVQGSGSTDVWLQLSGPIDTTLALKQGADASFDGLPIGQYTARLILPAGQTASSIRVGSNAVENAGAFTLHMTNAGLELALALSDKQDKLFYSTDSAVNKLANDTWYTQKNYQVDITATPQPGQAPHYYDLVLVLDYSGSMSMGMKGYPNEMNPAPGKRRADYLQACVKELVDTLVESAPAETQSRLSIVTFNDFGKLALDWTNIATLNRGQLYADMKAEKGPWNQAMETAADLGFKKAREQLTKPEIQGSANKPYLIYLTDGVCGVADEVLPPSMANVFWNNRSYSYVRNYFRIEAEVLNEAQIIKGPKGQLITGVDNIVHGYPKPNSAVPVEYHGAYMKPKQNESVLDAWKRYSISDSVPHAYNDFSTEQAGAFGREGIGCGAEIYSVGILQGDSYIEDVVKMISKFMSDVTTNPQENFFNVEDADGLYLAFRNFSGNITGSYKDAYVRYYVDNAFEVSFAGALPNQGRQGTTVIDGTPRKYIEWGPMDIDVAVPFSISITLTATELTYEGPPPGTEMVVAIVQNDKYVEINETNVRRGVTVRQM